MSRAGSSAGVALLFLLALSSSSVGATVTEPSTVEPSTDKPRTVSDLVEGVRPWVVSIEVERSRDVASPGGSQTGRLPVEARDYFTRPDGPVTGLLVDRRGHVLTSAYNVAGTLRSLRIRLDDGRVLAARILAKAEADDVALLRLEDSEELFEEDAWRDPPWASRSPGVGRFVFAIGRSPSVERPTVTEGIVSALGRNGERTLQMDAKLNYGNSGGPVLDLDGRIVGLSGFVGHTRTEWGFNSGIGFASTVETLKEILPRMLAGKNVQPRRRPFLGIRSSENNTEVVGAPVEEVVKDSSASAAGVQGGDVIVEFDGVRVESFNQLRVLIYTRRIGDEVSYRVRRGDETILLRGRLGSFPRG